MCIGNCSKYLIDLGSSYAAISAHLLSLIPLGTRALSLIFLEQGKTLTLVMGKNDDGDILGMGR